MITFPEVITENLTTQLDYNLEKCEDAILKLEQAPLDYFGSGSQDTKQTKRIQNINRAIKNFVVSSVVSEDTPIVANEIFDIQRWYKVAFPKEAEPYLVEDSMLEPDWENVKQQEDKIQVRWCKSPYLVSVSTNSSNKTASITSLPYVSRRNTELRLKAELPCEIPVDVEKLHSKFLSKLYVAISQAYDSETISKYLDNHGDSYYNSGYILVSKISSRIYWAPRLEDIYTKTVVLPPPGDPALIVSWKDCNFFIGAWETNKDDANLKSILDEFVI